MEQNINQPQNQESVKHYEKPSQSRYLCCVMLLALLLLGLHVTVGIFAIRWGDHRRDAGFFQPFSFNIPGGSYVDTAGNSFTINPFNYQPSIANANFLVQDYQNPLDPAQLYYQELQQEALYLFITSAVLLVFILVLFFAFCCNWHCNRTKHILVTLILVLEFAIAVVLILRYANNLNLQDTAIPWYQQFGWSTHSWRSNFYDFNVYYKLVLADWIATFALCLLLLAVFCKLLNDVATDEILHPVVPVVDIPPTNRQLNV